MLTAEGDKISCGPRQVNWATKPAVEGAEKSVGAGLTAGSSFQDYRITAVDIKRQVRGSAHVGRARGIVQQGVTTGRGPRSGP